MSTPVRAVSLGILAAALGLPGCVPSVDSNGNVACPANVCGSAPPSPLAPSPVAVGLNNSMVVTWPAVPDATGYSVYYSGTAGVTPQTGTLVSGAASPIVVSSLPNGVPAYAVVTARIGTVEGTASGQVTATPQATGSGDATFNGTGIVTSLAGAGGTDNRSLASVQDSQGRIVSAGSSMDGGGNTWMAVWRTLPDGTPDSTFGTGGVFTTIGAAGGLIDKAYGLTLDSQGRIVAVGISNDGTFYHSAVWRLTPAGALDTTFAGTGFDTQIASAGGTDNEGAYSVTTDALDRIVLTGETSPAPAVPWLLIRRYNSDGTPDTTFTDGACTTNGGIGACVALSGTGAGGFADYAAAIAIDSVGRIVLPGRSSDNSSQQWAVVWRFNPDGSLDTSFGSGGIIPGIVLLAFVGGGNGGIANAVAFDAAGNVVLAGAAGGSSVPNYMTVWRLLPDGTPDFSFNGTGTQFLTGAAGPVNNDQALAMVLDANGNILTAGTTQDSGGNNQLGIWRLTPSGLLDSTFGGGILVKPSPLGGPTVDPGTESMGLFLDPFGRIVVSAEATDPSSNEHLAIWRFIP